MSRDGLEQQRPGEWFGELVVLGEPERLVDRLGGLLRVARKRSEPPSPS